MGMLNLLGSMFSSIYETLRTLDLRKCQLCVFPQFAGKYSFNSEIRVFAHPHDDGLPTTD